MHFEKMKTRKLISSKLLAILAGALFLTMDFVGLLLAGLGDFNSGFLGGVVSAAVSTVGDTSSALALQADGKIVMVESGGFGLARYNPDGSLDSSFGTGGRVTTHISSDPEVGDVAFALALQADGKIVVVGRSWQQYSNDIAVARYNTDGSLDASFGKGGKVITDLSAGYDDAFALAIQADGKLVVGGLATDGIALVRYNPDGSSDFSFNSRVMVTRSKVGKIIIHALTLRSDGKIVAAGRSSYNRGLSSEFAVARYNPDGSLDPSFGTGGKVTTRTGTVDSADAVVIQPDGRIIVAGVSYNGRDMGFVVIRYTPDGSLDLGFGSGGKAVTAMGVRGGEGHLFGPQYIYGRVYGGIALQSDGKIVGVGSTNEGFVLLRYNSEGSLDPSFGTGGKVVTRIGTTEDAARALALQPDGKIVVAGASGGRPAFALVRYNPEGSLDPSFGVGGKVTTQIGTGYMVQ